MPSLLALWILVSAPLAAAINFRDLDFCLLTLFVAFFYPQESPEAVAFHKSQALGGRLTNITDIAPLVRFLVTEGGWVTGQTIFANGGYTTR